MSAGERMDSITTVDELRVMANFFISQTETRRRLDAVLLDKFWADQSYLATREDVLCAWSNLPSDEKMDFVQAWARDDAFSFFSVLSPLAKKQPVA